uniref:Uncharacterized protein n=1 Tax=Arundo donax TaxID=35708 RepID=A0A0A9ENA7_ARUDO
MPLLSNNTFHPIFNNC